MADRRWPVAVAGALALSAAYGQEAAGPDRLFLDDHVLDVQIVAPGGIAGAELGVRVNYRVPNWIGSLGGLFPGLPRGEYFTGSTTATFRQEGW